MAVSIELIKELRDRTGIGMGKCKEALVEANGDIELAIMNLRKAGMASAVKKEGRETKEGKIDFRQNAQAIALVEAKAETDFVVGNERFQEFLQTLTEEVLSSKSADIQAFLQKPLSKDPNVTIDQYRAHLVQTIGENIQVKRIEYLNKKPKTSYGVYSHMNGKILTLVEMEGSDGEEEFAREIAMHCAAAAPEYISPDSVPVDVVMHEREIAMSQVQDKPEAVREKIVAGKVQAFYDQSCLLCQKFVKDDSQTIAQMVERHAKKKDCSLHISRFIRWVVGE